MIGNITVTTSDTLYAINIQCKYHVYLLYVLFYVVSMVI